MLKKYPEVVHVLTLTSESYEEISPPFLAADIHSIPYAFGR